MDLVNKNMATDGTAYFEMKLPKGSGTGGGADYSNMIGAIIAANKIIEQQKTPSSSSNKEEKKKIYSREEIDALIAEADRDRK
jgi:hypothetical protein